MDKLKLRVEALTQCLSTTSFSRLYNVLTEIRTKIIKSPNGPSCLLSTGSVSKLLDILRRYGDLDCSSSKIVNIVLSILGNLCMNDAPRDEVLKHGGIYVMERYFCENNMESIQNRCCRTIANLALSDKGCEAIHKTEIVQRLVELLENTENVESKQTYIRAVRLFARTKQQKDRIVECGLILLVAKGILSEHSELKKAAIRTIFELSKGGCSSNFAMQVVSAGVVKEIVSIATSKEIQVVSELSHQCRSTLFELVCHPNVRPVFGAADGIQIFLKRLKLEESQTERLLLLNVLCLCCKESVNRVKLRENGALTLFLDVLNDSAYHKIHDRIISSLACFLYDERSLAILLESDMIRCLLRHLQRVANFQSVVWSTDHIKEESQPVAQHVEDKIFEKFYLIRSEIQTCITNTKQTVEDDKVEEKNDQEKNSEEFQERTALYSIDSPTYKGSSERNMDEYISGVPQCKEAFDMEESSLSSLSPLSAVSYLSPEMSPSAFMSPEMSPLAFSSPASSDEGVTSTNPNSVYPVVFSAPYSPMKGYSMSSSSQVSDDAALEEYIIFSSEDEKECDRSPSNNKLKEHAEGQSNDRQIAFQSKTVHLVKSDTHHKKKQSAIVVENCEYENPLKRRKIDFSLEEINERSEHRSPTSLKKCKLRLQRGPNNTECNILILISRISQMDDPSKYLVTMETVCCLLDYLCKVHNPEKRAYRILTRLIQNQLCFEKFLTFNVTLLVYYKLLYGQDDQLIHDNLQSDSLLTANHNRQRSSISFIDKESGWQDLSESNKVENPNNEYGKKENSNIKLSEKHEENINSEGSHKKETESEKTNCSFDSEKDLHPNFLNDMRANDMLAIQSGLTFLHDLSVQAISPFGRGVIGHWLHRKGEQDRNMLKLALPFMIWTKEAFEFYLLERGIFQEISDFLYLAEDSNFLCNIAVEGLCFMGNLLMSPKLTDKEIYQNTDNLISKYRSLSVSELLDCKLSNQMEHDVYFSVDGALISGHRSILVNSTPFFKAMLGGSYTEANSNVITLHDTTKYAVRYLLHYLHGCTKNCDIIRDIVNLPPTNNSLSHHLETIALAHTYMLTELVEFLLTVLIKHIYLLEPELLRHTFQFARIFDFVNLADESIKALFTTVKIKTRKKGFYKFLETSNHIEFLNHIPCTIIKC